ncbi:PIN domain-containing protein [Fodinicola acaciae]|uniref:PIN domain-containing protein n=1 Tax=Fodinicola acaciae TaxID=2681555 RepID=UPI0013D72764|nr:PIN domain-containing protein [Fodinicola acaciae]
MRLVLDAEAVNALMDANHPAERRVRGAVEAARRLRRDVVIPTVTLAELYRGASRSKWLDGLLAREHGDGMLLRDTDRQLARLVGAVLSEAGAGSDLLADAHAVAVAVEAGGGVVMTADEPDLARLAAPYRTVVVESVDGGKRARRRH